jgi:hypothetical protein
LWGGGVLPVARPEVDVADEAVLKQNVSGVFKHKILNMKRLLLPMLVWVFVLLLEEDLI